MKVRITVEVPGTSVTGRDVSNAVRRSLSEQGALSQSGVVKGVKYIVKATKPDTSLKHIRAWAAKNGYTLGKRGRIAAEVREAYHAANPS